jgi:hypothetical protein
MTGDSVGASPSGEGNDHPRGGDGNDMGTHVAVERPGG